MTHVVILMPSFASVIIASPVDATSSVVVIATFPSVVIVATLASVVDALPGVGVVASLSGVVVITALASVIFFASLASVVDALSGVVVVATLSGVVVVLPPLVHFRFPGLFRLLLVGALPPATLLLLLLSLALHPDHILLLEKGKLD
jgi:hypothetical protein